MIKKCLLFSFLMLGGAGGRHPRSQGNFFPLLIRGCSPPSNGGVGGGVQGHRLVAPFFLVAQNYSKSKSSAALSNDRGMVLAFSSLLLMASFTMGV